MRSSSSSSARPAWAGRLAVPLVAGAALLAAARPACAGEPSPEEAAAAAYERGTAAFQRGEFAAAAQEFARADELSPNPVALESALKAALRANDPALGMDLWERAKRARGGTEELARLAALARERFAARAGQVMVACPARLRCAAKIDGKPAPLGQRRWYAAGPRRLELRAGDETERRRIVVVAGASVEVRPLSAVGDPPAEAEAPEAASAAEPAAADVPAPAEARVPAAVPAAAAAPGGSEADSGASGVSPVWFWVAGGVTLVAGGLTVASAVDTLGKHDAFLALPTPETESAGRSAQTRTNVLLGVTGAAAVATAALGLFVVRWSDGEAAASASAAPDGVRVAARVRF